MIILSCKWFFSSNASMLRLYLRSSATETADPSLSLPSSHDKRSSFVVFETEKQGKHTWHCGHKQKLVRNETIHQNRNFFHLGKKLPGSWESWIVKPRKHLMLLGDLNREKATIIYAGYCLSLVMAIYHIFFDVIARTHNTDIIKIGGLCFPCGPSGPWCILLSHLLSYPPPYLCMQWPKSFFFLFVSPNLW